MRVDQGSAADLDWIAEIYTHYVLTSAHTFDVTPKPPSWWRDWFSTFEVSARYQLVVVRDDGRLVGFAHSGPYKEREAYASSVMTSVYVAPDHVGRGVGHALYGELIGSLQRRDIHRAYAAISIPNPASISLHERHGFQQAGYFSEQGKKFGRYWDVAWYERPC